MFHPSVDAPTSSGGGEVEVQLWWQLRCGCLRPFRWTTEGLEYKATVVGSGREQLELGKAVAIRVRFCVHMADVAISIIRYQCTQKVSGLEVFPA